MALAELEILLAMAGRGVDEAGAGIVGDVIAFQEQDREIVALPAQRMRRGVAERRELVQPLQRDLGMLRRLLGQLVGERDLLAQLRERALFPAATTS